jgi:hypothetical protein
MPKHSAPPPLQPDSQPDTFRVESWKVFRPGYHKGRLFTREHCQQAAANFQLLSTGENPHLRPKAKFGHDSQERIQQSLGLPNLGVITRCEYDPTDGGFFIDVSGIPAKLMLPNAATGEPELFDLKAEFDRGGFNDGSVELAFDVPDPLDPSKTLPGPVLEGVAFLGEEQPAVRGLPSPRATFSAGQLSTQQYRTTNGHRSRVFRIAFSEVDPMPTRDEILSQLKELGIDVDSPELAGKTDEELFSMLKVLKDDGFQASLKKKYAAQPEPKPEPKPDADKDSMAAKFAQFMDECTKRMGAMETAVGDMQKLKPDVQAAAKFSQDYTESRRQQKLARVTEAVAAAVAAGKLAPDDREDKIAAGMTRDDVSKFSSGDHNGKTPLEVWLANLQGREASFMFSEMINDNANAGGTKPLSAAARAMLSNTPRGMVALASIQDDNQD